MKYIELKNWKKPCIYRFSFPDGHFYIGKTKNMRDRLKLYKKSIEEEERGGVMSYLLEYGLDGTEMEILCSPAGLDESDLDTCLAILEIKYIRELGACGGLGLNQSFGGEVLGIAPEAMDLSLKYGNLRGVLVYDMDGVFVEEYESMARCAYSLGVTESKVVNSVDKNILVAGRYQLRKKRYNEIPASIESFVPAKRREPKYKPMSSSARCRKRRVYRKGHEWSSLINDFPIIQKTKDGEIVGRYGNLKEASEQTGIDYSGIWRCIFRGGHSSGGYIWAAETPVKADSSPVEGIKDKR